MPANALSSAITGERGAYQASKPRIFFFHVAIDPPFSVLTYVLSLLAVISYPPFLFLFFALRNGQFCANFFAVWENVPFKKCIFWDSDFHPQGGHYTNFSLST